MVVLPCRIQTAFGRPFLASFGDDARGVRAVAQRDLDHLLGRRHFEIERQAGRLLYTLQVAVADMPPVLAQMRGNAIAADMRDDFCGAHRIGMLPAACVADGRDMVDIDPKAEAACHVTARLPGLTASVAASSGGNSSGA